MSKYRYENNTFIIEDYDVQKPFASFLPGVAGVKGIPMWVYYTNRGQGIAGFGVENKDGAIMDFVPANMAYRRTELQGYRTFIKSKGRVHEIFSSISSDDVKREMHIETNAVSFCEYNKTLGIKVLVKYFTVTNQDYPGLVRKVTIEALESRDYDIQVVDGLMTLWPYKNENFVIKNMSNLAVAWFEVFNAENNMPFYRNRSTTEDSAAVGQVEAGHFYVAYTNEQEGPVPVIYDPDVLFGNYTGIIKPMGFESSDVDDLIKTTQVSANKLPCAFAIGKTDLKKPYVMTSCAGKLTHIDKLMAMKETLSVHYFETIESEAKALGETLTADVDGKTAFPLFDAYVKQSYLDNMLRGGYPLVFQGKDEPIVYHVFSRIHGDMEREYNDFYVEPAYYSHGRGNFRDVNQNRRNDVYFVKEAGLYNVKQFMELLQMDGLNPLSIRGSQLKVEASDIQDILDLVVNKQEVIEEKLVTSFTPGGLLTTITDHNIDLSVSADEFLEKVMSKAVQTNEASYGHGFWVDHWTYNMDLVDNYLNIYPDHKDHLMFQVPLKYFVSPEIVLKRDQKYVQREDGQIRQYHALITDEERVERLGLEPQGTNWHKKADGSIFETDLFTKLLIHTMNKITSLDPSGIGIMMNTDKPGWNDAMNGLPGIFGSGTSEVVELNRIVKLLKSSLKNDMVCKVPEAVHSLMDAYVTTKNGQVTGLRAWEAIQDAKEAYNDAIKYEIPEAFVDMTYSQLASLLDHIQMDIDMAVEKAIAMGDGIMVTFLTHEAKAYELLSTNHPVIGLPNVKVTEWSVRALPLYLEAPARYLKQTYDLETAKKMYQSIKKSGMYDETLKMYVTSESLEEESLEIGRARAFTAGWLEREAVFMHMEYKYFLGLIKSGLYNEFFESIETALPPFLDPAVYGRSTLENSSFIASSRNPNKDNHGRGFVSRLTGTTSEMITMWLLMMTGGKIFKYDDVLSFQLKPVISNKFFDEKDQVKARILGHIQLTYYNPSRKDTFGPDGAQVKSYELSFVDGSVKQMDQVVGQDALSIRNGLVKEILVILE